MTPDDLRAWQQTLGLSQHEAARTIGVKPRMYSYYLRGKRDGKTGREVQIPLTVALACAARLHRLPPLGETSRST